MGQRLVLRKHLSRFCVHEVEASIKPRVTHESNVLFHPVYGAGPLMVMLLALGKMELHGWVGLRQQDIVHLQHLIAI
jgi:hypothetical protein